MEKIHVEDGVEFSDSFLISSKKVSIMEGKILTLIELLGLPREQSEALKAEIRNRIWGSGFIAHAHFIPAEDNPRVCKLLNKIEEEKMGTSEAN